MSTLKLAGSDKESIEKEVNDLLRRASRLNRYEIKWTYCEPMDTHECEIKIRTTCWMVLPFIVYKLIIFPFESIRNLYTDIASEFGF